MILYMTKRCNMRCPHCIFRLYNKDCFSDEDLDVSFGKQIISYYKHYGIKELYLTAEGEPLLYEHLPEILSFSKNKNFERIHLNTNGRLLQKYINSILEYVDSIYISVDGYNRETYKNHRESDAFARVIKNINKLVKARKKHKNQLFISIACVIHQQNLNYIEKMIQLANNLNVNRIEFYNFHPIQTSLPIPTCTPVYQSIETTQYFETIKSKQYQMEIVLPAPVSDKKHFYCENLFNWIVIGAGGNYSPCCQIPPHKKFGNFHDDPEYFFKGEIGHFKTKFTRAESTSDLHGSCKDCNGLSPENDIFFPDMRIWTKRYPVSNYCYSFTPSIT